MVDGLIVAARFAHYAAATGLFGLCLFAALAWPVKRGLLVGLAAAGFVTTLVWFAATAASMGGGLDVSILQVVATQTPAGRAAIAGAVLALTSAGFANAGWRKTNAITAGLFVSSLALSGHTQLHDGFMGVIHSAADGVHLLGAGAWLGGLIALGVLLTSEDPEKSARVATFSKVGYLAVAALVLSGAVNTALILPSPAALISTLYGRLLLVKLALFGGMLILALYNRLRISPALPLMTALEQLRRNAMVEQGLGALILAIVSVLGTLDPAA